MKRTAMRRTGFRRPELPPRPRPVLVPRSEPARARMVSRETTARLTVALPKECAIQHEGYMAAVRKLPCARCGISGYTQFCHADMNKGTGLRTDCRRGWPGCGPHDDKPGCHWYVGTSGRMLKAERRSFEEQAGRATRAAILAAGLWPKNLPMWEGA